MALVYHPRNRLRPRKVYTEVEALMPLQIWFWVFYVVAFLFYNWVTYDSARPWFRWGGGGLLIFILIGILGYKVFGSAVTG